MRNFQIKVCGINDLGVAKYAENIGVDLLGFIFYKKSVRFVSMTKAKIIIKELKPTTATVGVFVNEPVSAIVKTARLLKLNFIQLSGAESIRDIRAIQKAGYQVVKTYHINDNSDIKKGQNSKADIIHLDNADKNNYGGTGKRFDWKIKLPKGIDYLMLSGGINIDNVDEGVKKFKPLIIDVNSGVETKPGKKSKKKIKEFINHCNTL